MGADGQSILAATDGLGPLWGSIDGGSTWKELTCAGRRSWSGVAIAGGFQVAVDRGGFVWSNTSPGDGWSSCGPWVDLGPRDWASVAAAPSGDEIRLAAAVTAGASRGQRVKAGRLAVGARLHVSAGAGNYRALCSAQRNPVTADVPASLPHLCRRHMGSHLRCGCQRGQLPPKT